MSSPIIKSDFYISSIFLTYILLWILCNQILGGKCMLCSSLLTMWKKSPLTHICIYGTVGKVIINFSRMHRDVVSMQYKYVLSSCLSASQSEEPSVESQKGIICIVAFSSMVSYCSLCRYCFVSIFLKLHDY